MSKKVVEQKPAEKVPDQKAIQAAIDLLATLDADQASTVLANIKGPALTAALKAQKEQDDKKRAEQDKAIQDSMKAIGKILDEAKIDRTVVFHRTDKGSWDPKFPKNRSGVSSGGGRKAKSLTDEMRAAIDGALSNGGKPPKPDKDSTSDIGTIGAFMFGDIKIPTTLICWHLIENYDARSDNQIVDMVGSWGIKDTQARGALTRHKN